MTVTNSEQNDHCNEIVVFDRIAHSSPNLMNIDV